MSDIVDRLAAVEKLQAALAESFAALDVRICRIEALLASPAGGAVDPLARQILKGLVNLIAARRHEYQAQQLPTVKELLAAAEPLIGKPTPMPR